MSVPARRYFTVDEYHRMGEAGIFSENDRVELIEGEILKMSPIGSHHAATVNRLNRQLNILLGNRAVVSVQNPLLLNDLSEPQPDLAVVKPRADFYAHAHPTAGDTLLVIEVADTTAAYDRDIKLPAYARSGVPEVWIVDLPTEIIESHANPIGGIYQNTRAYRRDESFAPITFPDLAIEVASILG